MFTGIIEATGRVVHCQLEGSNTSFTIQADLASELKIDQSVSHNGVCLTVVACQPDHYTVTAVEETLRKTNLNEWKIGDIINLERCMPANGRFDGHIVQGHVDQIGTCIYKEERDGSWLFDFSYDPTFGNVTVEKGSISINGVSLTVFNSAPDSFRVTIIPYTYDFTNFSTVEVGDQVNLEFDVLGKYIKRILTGYQP
ncbi:riboflavin synthase [Dyadobacter tibetensis]|uniref:riboflavin synthase n=1 Tax=Dyadobacter tibetensis TaxID=1211851 RepID=UPI00046ECE3C|nr:riboflavin synthase [Dyadobacter tibetensis]